MSITTYTELQSAVDNWLGHTLFTARVPEFIAMAEASFNRRLRVRQQETFANILGTFSGTTDTSAGAGDLPTDYLAWRRVIVITSSQTLELQYLHPTQVDNFFPNLTDPATPRYFTIIGSNIYPRPFPSSTEIIQLTYYAKVPSLASAVNGTNWLLTEHPDLYLFGSLIEAEAFGENDQRLPLWKARRDEIYDEIERLSNRTKSAGVVRVMQATP